MSAGPSERPFRVFHNSFLLYGAELCTHLFHLLVTVYAAKQMGPQIFGHFVFGTTLVYFVLTLGDFGLTTYLLKEAGARAGRAPSLAWEVYRLKGGLGALVVGLTTAYLLQQQMPMTVVRFVFIVGCSAVLGAFAAVLGVLLKASDRFWLDSLLRISGRGVYLLAAVVALQRGKALAGLAIAALVAALWEFGLAALINARLRLMPFRGQGDDQAGDWRLTLRAAWPYGILAVLSLLYFRIDVLMLEAMKGSTEVGFYGAGYKVLEGLLLVPWACGTALLPVLGRQLAQGDVLPAQVLAHRAMRYLAYGGVGMATLTSLLAPEIIAGLYPSGMFQSAVSGLRVLAWTIVAVSISPISSALINASGAPGINLRIAAAMVVTNVGLNFLLIPPWGLVGAGLATVVTECAGLALGAAYIQRRLMPFPYLPALLRAAVAAGVMSGVILWHKSLWLLPLYVGVYGGILTLCGGLSWAEWQTLRLRRSCES